MEAVPRVTAEPVLRKEPEALTPVSWVRRARLPVALVAVWVVRLRTAEPLHEEVRARKAAQLRTAVPAIQVVAAAQRTSPTRQSLRRVRAPLTGTSCP